MFPHEVVGFSGGNKYFFPGVSGPELIDLSHWLGALITSYAIIGTPGITPVRRLIHRAADLIPTEKRCLAGRAIGHGRRRSSRAVYRYAGNRLGRSRDALRTAAHHAMSISPYKRVLSVMPPMYDDIWTAAKGMYKLEPVIADGGEVIIYAPHITEFSYTHGKLLAEIGYHVRDYFVKQWDQFKRLSRRHSGAQHPPARDRHLRSDQTVNSRVSASRWRPASRRSAVPRTIWATAIRPVSSSASGKIVKRKAFCSCPKPVRCCIG